MTSNLSTVKLPSAIFNRGTLKTKDGVILSAEDKLEMQEAIRQFASALKSENGIALCDRITDDIEIDHPFGYVKGKEDLFSGKGPAIPFFGLRHSYINQVAFIDEEGAAAMLSHMLITQVTSEVKMDINLPTIYGSLITVHSFRKENNEWKIHKIDFDQLKLSDHLKESAENEEKNSESISERLAKRTS